MAYAQVSSRPGHAELGNDDRQSSDRNPPLSQHSALPSTVSGDKAKQIPSDYRKVVFCDPVAFRYLEEDDLAIVIDRDARLQGYELYVVEQWVCSRTHPTFIICTYTGDPLHSILVNVLAVPSDQQKWSPRLTIYFQAVSEFHAREQDTPLGRIHVTNLSSFPSALTVISVSDGNVKKHKDDLMVNENLKRMGCAGRAAITLTDPPASTVAKYYHLFATSEAVPVKASVIELVKLCQMALVLYGKLNSIYADGLLCDITERAVGDWWDDIGTEFHNVEPSDGIFGPTTVAALLGLLVGAHNRLKSAGITVGKDAFDLLAMKRSIGHFQKAYKITKSRRLDRETLDRLHRTTAKIASGDGWAVPRAVKSTVAELGGKGGEMVMGMVGAKEKAGIAEIETVDIERFAQLVPGGKLKWIWQGKPMKNTIGDAFSKQADDLRGRVNPADDDGTFLWTGSSQDPQDNEKLEGTTFGNSTGDRKLGRLRGAVGLPGLRSHHTRMHKTFDDNTDAEEPATEVKDTGLVAKHRKPVDNVLRNSGSFKHDSSSEKAEKLKPAMNLSLAASEISTPAVRTSGNHLTPVHDKHHPHHHADNTMDKHQEQLQAASFASDGSPKRRRVERELKKIRKELNADVYQNFATEFDERGPQSTLLRRSKSAKHLRDVEMPSMHLLSLPRHLSFDTFDDLVRDAKSASFSDRPETNDVSIYHRLQFCEGRLLELQALTTRLLNIEQHLLPYAETEVQKVLDFDETSQKALAGLNNTYYGRLEDYQTLQATSRELIAREKTALNDSLKRMEMLGQKLEYELNALDSRMKEVEDGTAEFEHNVLEIEARVSALTKSTDNETSGIPWLQRMINFFSK